MAGTCSRSRLCPSGWKHDIGIRIGVPVILPSAKVEDEIVGAARYHAAGFNIHGTITVTIRESARGGELRGFASGSGLERGPYKLVGEDVPACLEIAVLVGHHLPRFERLLFGVCFDHNHLDGFARLEACAGEIDIGKWLVILLIGGQGRLGVRRLGALAALGGLVCNALVRQTKYLRGPWFVQLVREVGRSAQGAFLGGR
jgi:hypothetical protein